jgi:hypothetical protein
LSASALTAASCLVRRPVCNPTNNQPVSQRRMSERKPGKQGERKQQAERTRH